jgi:hypothetical protein
MPKMNVIKSIYVDAAPEKIYPIINDLSNWEQWSPWVIAEPNAQLNVAADGKYHEWDGEIIGAGTFLIKCFSLSTGTMIRRCSYSKRPSTVPQNYAR